MKKNLLYKANPTKKKAKMILEKLQELIKEKESKNNELVFKHRG